MAAEHENAAPEFGWPSLYKQVVPSITHPPYLGALLHPPNPVEARKGTRNTVNRAVSMIPPHIDASRRVSFFTTGGELPRGWFERNLIPTKTLNWKRRYTGSVQYMYSTSQRVRGEYIYMCVCERSSCTPLHVQVSGKSGTKTLLDDLPAGWTNICWEEKHEIRSCGIDDLFEIGWFVRKRKRGMASKAPAHKW